MSAKVTVTYKRKRGASHARAADGVVPEPPPVSGSVVTRSEATKHGVDADADVFNGDDSVRNFNSSLSLFLEFFNI
jgi:hypothetical protein